MSRPPLLEPPLAHLFLTIYSLYVTFLAKNTFRPSQLLMNAGTPHDSLLPSFYLDFFFFFFSRFLALFQEDRGGKSGSSGMRRLAVTAMGAKSSGWFMQRDSGDRCMSNFGGKLGSRMFLEEKNIGKEGGRKYRQCFIMRFVVKVDMSNNWKYRYLIQNEFSAFSLNFVSEIVIWIHYVSNAIRVMTIKS